MNQTTLRSPRTLRSACPRVATCLLICVLLALGLGQTWRIASAADGDLDPSFGIGGKVIGQFSGFDAIYDMAQQLDGKLVVVGESDYAFVVARYNSDGSMDQNFGANGSVRVTAAFWTPGGFNVRDGERISLALQTDGKILIGGSVNSATLRDFCLMRFNADGASDPTFGTAGIVKTNIPGAGTTFDDNSLEDFVIQTDGKILAVGSGMARYNADGSLDQSFGSGGVIAAAAGMAAALQADGKIILALGAGYRHEGLFDHPVQLERRNTDGSKDFTFGSSNGFASIQFVTDRDASPRDVLVQPDGKIVVAGYSFTTGAGSPKNCAIARVNSDGSPDLSFGTGGKQLTDAGGFNEISRIALQPDGSIVAAGTKSMYTGADNFLVMRYLSNGTLDTSFGTGGITTTDFLGRRDWANGLALQSDGRIVLGGLVTTLSTGRDFGLARYSTSGVLDPTFGAGGRVTTSFLSPANGAPFGDVVVQPNGKILAGGAMGDSFLLARYNPDGSLDQTLGGVGFVTTSFDDFLGANHGETLLEDARIVALALLPDGRIMAAGDDGAGSNFGYDKHFLLARYNSDGSLDTTFSGDGLLNEYFNGSSTQAIDEGMYDMLLEPSGNIIYSGFVRTSGSGHSVITRRDPSGNLLSGFVQFDGRLFHSLALLPDGKLLAAGTISLFSVNNGGGFILERFAPDGQVDPTFNSGDLVTTSFSGTGSANSIQVQPDLKILLAGTVGAGDLGLARYNFDGSLDNSFGMGGTQVTDFSSTEKASSLAILADGKFLVGGGWGADFLLARYNSNGTLDTSLAGSGRIITDLGTGNDRIAAIAVQANGGVVAAGFPGLVRYQNAVGPAASPTPTPTPSPTPAGTCVLGVLDTTFDTDGRVTTDYSSSTDQANAVAIQLDGKIVVAGVARTSGNDDFGLARYNPDGSPDTSFDGDGRVTTAFGTGTDSAATVAIQPDGKIIAAGFTVINGDAGFALARYNSNGSLDTSFDTDGKVVTQFSDQSDQAFGVVIQPDGKIVAVGKRGIGDAQDFALARYNANGSLDTTFDTDGLVTTNFGGLGDRANAVALQFDGKIVVAGFSRVGSTDDFALARYNSHGSLDTTFSSDGLTTTAIAASTDQAFAVAIQSDGRIVTAGGSSDGFDLLFAVTRHNTDGTLDTSFDTDGKVIDNALRTVAGLALQPDGKIVTAGYARPASNDEFAVARLNQNGSRDNTFSDDGRVTTDFDTQSDRALAVALQTDGGIVAAGVAHVGSSDDFAVARYFGKCEPSNSVALSFSQSSYNVSEDYTTATLTVNRAGDNSSSVSVDFATADITALQRTDYSITSGTMKFAAGEASKTISVLINKDAYVEPAETFSVTLANPTGGALLATPSVATVTIADSAAQNGNTIDDNSNFVQQHYHDFLARRPDQDGLAYWTTQLAQCGSDANCLRTQRVNTSDAFFFEQEYQKTGAYVFRIYRAAFGNTQPSPNGDASDPNHLKLPGYSVFAPDRARVVGGPTLAQGQLDFATVFVQRAPFVAKYPESLAGPGFVDALVTTIRNDLGVDLATQRAALITLFNSGGRGAVLYRLADDSTTNPIDNHLLIDAEYNRAFVATQYFGYLRRDSDMGGFSFWLGQLSSAPPRDIDKQHALVCAFITSAEYQNRFGAEVTHGNSECGR